jgi:3-deoxy-manno-octulosonate cytidylyltransferase (CMP-KDO synthetase)
MKAIGVIPARLGSTRLARKVLREIAGRPMLHYIWCTATSCSGLADVIIATDSEEVLEVCRKNKWQARLTSAAHASGTDRVWEVASQIPADVYLNIQGDEPLARREHIETLLRLMQDPGVAVGTLKTPCAAHDVANPNAVKVVTDNSGRALYFSRATVPFDRDGGSAPRYFKHLGFYAYRSPALRRFCSIPPGELERAERLEQLRFLEHGIPIHVAETPFDTIGVDTEADLQRVQAMLGARPQCK